VHAWLGVDDLDGLRRRFSAWEARRSPDGAEQWLNWIVRDRADGRPLGWAQATVRGATASVAYSLLLSARGRGAASDALRAITRWLRAERGVADVRATIAPDNVASGRVARAAGFAPTDLPDPGWDVVWIHRQDKHA
jgi:RimJ/RimL family protein N-acetyltransferase